MTMLPKVRALMALARVKAKPTDDTVLGALTDWFGSKDAISADHLPDDLVGMLVAIGVSRTMAVQAGKMVLARPLSGRTRIGSPDPFPGMPLTRRVATEEPGMRANYLLAAARRLTKADDDGTYEQAVNNEHRYLDAHVAAGKNRRAAARRVDELGKDGHTLVWRTVMDEHTTPECAALDGRIFMASNPPGIPGAMHSRCRCSAEPWGGAPLLH